MKKLITKPVSKQAKWQDPNWVYTPSVATNVLKRFKEQFGWVPPSETPKSN
jgi:hypothetical protein